MSDYGFAMIVPDPSFAPKADALKQIEETLAGLQVIGERISASHPGCQTVEWSPGLNARVYIEGNPRAISVYVGEPTPYFDGNREVATTRFYLETMDGNPEGLKPILSHILGVDLTMHPFRI